MADTRKCGHKYIVPSVCEECRTYIEGRRQARKNARRRRIPPLQHCDYGHEWRGYSEACPECAKLPKPFPGETLAEFRRRLHLG